MQHHRSTTAVLDDPTSAYVVDTVPGRNGNGRLWQPVDAADPVRLEPDDWTPPDGLVIVARNPFRKWNPEHVHELPFPLTGFLMSRELATELAVKLNVERFNRVGGRGRSVGVWHLPSRCRRAGHRVVQLLTPKWRPETPTAMPDEGVVATGLGIGDARDLIREINGVEMRLRPIHRWAVHVLPLDWTGSEVADVR